jgi:cytochrome P450
MIAHHPKVLQKLREEVASMVGLGSDARQPTRDDLKQMTYLSHTINESLRLYPPVPVNQRAASRMTTLPTGGGPDGKSPIMIREGESVGYLIYGMHRRKDIFGEDAKAFRPERWENDAQKKFGYGFLPFGAGPRACLGQEFARTETAYTVARMIQWFPYWVVPEGETTELGKEKQLLTIVVSCAEGVRIKLYKEEPAS